MRMKTAGCRIVGWEQAPPNGVCPRHWTPAFAGVTSREVIVIVMTEGGPSERSISYQSPGHAFGPIASAGCCQKTKL